MSRIKRPKQAAAYLGVGISKFHEDYVDRGDDPALGSKRAIGFFVDELDRLLEELRTWRDASPRSPPKRAVAPEHHPSRHRRSEVAP
jgi:hypothetical protein